MNTLSFEPIRVSDIAKLNDLQPQDWPDIIPKIMSYINHGFCYPIKLLFKSEIVGIGSVYHSSAIAFLKSKGFSAYATAKRMSFGTALTVKFENIYNRIAGNIG